MQMADTPSRYNNSTHRLIPGGAHTYSKGDDQFPANGPRFLNRGEGSRVWDETGREFLDWTSGLRTMSLGYGVRPVLDAAIAQMELGSNFGRPSSIETEFAAELIDVIPCADMVKFAKNGSTVTTAAVKLARVYTGRDYIALCADHAFFSYDDWFIGATVMNAGVPKAIQDLSLTFRYNDIASVEALFASHPGKIACVILEAATMDHPAPGFFEKLEEICRREGAVLILDEMITGFRWHLNGAQKYYGITPDLATFGKGMANGFAVSALVGRREIMELGGIDHDRERVFLISTTHGAENHALAAARATLKICREEGVQDHMWAIGGSLIAGLNEAAKEAGLAEVFVAGGVPCSPWYSLTAPKPENSLPLRTLFLQEMAERGVIANYLAPSWSHRQADVDRTVEAARGSLPVVSRALEDGYEKYLKGPSIKPVFRPFN
jgi:glutamate-1-semialdehyde 2,1-aminomutase